MSSWTTITVETKDPEIVKREFVELNKARFGDYYKLSDPCFLIRTDELKRANMDLSFYVFTTGEIQEVYIDFLRRVSPDVQSAYVLSMSDTSHQGTLKRYEQKETYNKSWLSQAGGQTSVYYISDTDLRSESDEQEWWLKCNRDAAICTTYEDIRDWYWNQHSTYPMIGGNWYDDDTVFSPFTKPRNVH